MWPGRHSREASSSISALIGPHHIRTCTGVMAICKLLFFLSLNPVTIDTTEAGEQRTCGLPIALSDAGDGCLCDETKISVFSVLY